MRIAMISMHTSPLARPGSGDAGGMNVYIDSASRELARRGVAVDVFTLADVGAGTDTVAVTPGYRVHRLAVDRNRSTSKEDLPHLVCDFGAELLAFTSALGSRYDIIHSHYWLSGRVGMLASAQWDVPHVHTMHTAARVKNLFRADGETPEPLTRIGGEDRIVARADRLIANTEVERHHLVSLYGADRRRVDVANPGVDLGLFRPRDAGAVRDELGIPTDEDLLLFAGRIQPLKAPDLAVRVLAELEHGRPMGERGARLVISGGSSGQGHMSPQSLMGMAAELGVADRLIIEQPRDRDRLAQWFAAADLTLVPSYNETFGLVAVESQAAGTPVVAARVGGLTTAVADGRSGVLVEGHDPAEWGRVVASLLGDRRRLGNLSRGARSHAQSFSWRRNADALLDSYRAARSGAMLSLVEPASATMAS